MNGRKYFSPRRVIRPRQMISTPSTPRARCPRSLAIATDWPLRSWSGGNREKKVDTLAALRGGRKLRIGAITK